MQLTTLLKGLNFALSPSVLLIEGILRGVEVISMLWVEAAEEVWQETAWTHKMPKKLRNNKQGHKEGPSHTYYELMIILLSYQQTIAMLWQSTLWITQMWYSVQRLSKDATQSADGKLLP